MPTLTLLENVMVGAHEKTSAGMIRTVLDSKKFREEEKVLKNKESFLFNQLSKGLKRNNYQDVKFIKF